MFIDDKDKPNVEILKGIRIKGQPFAQGSIVSKKDFPDSNSWKNLATMEPPRVKQTKAAVKAADKPAKKTTAKKTTAKPAAPAAKLPGTE